MTRNAVAAARRQRKARALRFYVAPVTCPEIREAIRGEYLRQLSTLYIDASTSPLSELTLPMTHALAAAITAV